MDTTEINQPDFSPAVNPELVITAEAKYYLHVAGGWATFLSVLGFIVTGFIVLVIFFIGALMTWVISSQQQLGNLSQAAAMGSGINFFRIIYLGIAVVNFFGALYLNQFASKIKQAVAINDSSTATNAFASLKSFFKLVGITAIVVISLDLLFLILFIAGIVSSYSAMHNTY